MSITPDSTELNSTPENTPDQNGDSSGVQYTTAYLAPTQTVAITGLWRFFIEKIFHLNVYGNTLLSRRALFDLRAFTLLLLVVFSFDLAAWWLFWNMVFNYGQITLSIYTPLAFIPALMLSSIIIIYERQWVITDLSRKNLRVFLAAVFRLIVIAVAAYATAQPVEVLTFSGQIRKRIHQESVRLEAKRMLPMYADAVRDAGERIKDREEVIEDVSVRTKKREEVGKDAKDAKEKKDRLQAAVTSAEQDVEVAKTALRNAENIVIRKGSKRAVRRRMRWKTSRITGAKKRLKKAEEDKKQAEENLETNKQTIERTITEDKELTEEAVQREDDGKERKEKIKKWIADISNIAPNTPKENGYLKRTYQDEGYDFFEQLAIINDLAAGRPAKWLNATPEEIKTIKTEFGLEDPINDDRLKQDAETFWYWWWIIFLVAFIIPLLVFAAKLLMSEDLRNYYSEENQRRHLDYDSIILDRVGCDESRCELTMDD